MFTHMRIHGSAERSTRGSARSDEQIRREKPLILRNFKDPNEILAPLRTSIREYQRHDHYIF